MAKQWPIDIDGNEIDPSTIKNYSNREHKPDIVGAVCCISILVAFFVFAWRILHALENIPQ